MTDTRRFCDLDAPSVDALFAKLAAWAPGRFGSLEALVAACGGRDFEGGTTHLSRWEGKEPRAALGVVVREMAARGEVYVTAVGAETGAALDALLAEAEALAAEGVMLRVGLAPDQGGLEPVLAARGYALGYEALVLGRGPEPLALTELAGWGVEPVMAKNAEAYRRVLDEAFRGAPNGASTSAEDVAAMMAGGNILALARLDGQAVGALELRLEEGVGWIESLAVAPEAQGRGLGKRLLGEAIATLAAHGAERLALLVMGANQAALTLYLGQGFVRERVRSRWWQKRAAKYDRIGLTYEALRRPDPRIAAAIHAALGDARTVLNVGAGTGSYEPTDREVTAVEPSIEMIRKRRRPAVQASAEALPFADKAFDAAMAVLTVHHWPDKAAGLRELRRVTRGPIVLLTFDPACRPWLTDYLPELAALDEAQMPAMADYERWLGPVQVLPVPVPHDCSDGFLYAYWRRPEAYLDERARSGISSFWALDAREGLARLARDLETGVWHRRHAGLLESEAYDAGYRLVVAPGG